MIEYRESIITKIFNKIKDFFYIKKYVEKVMYEKRII